MDVIRGYTKYIVEKQEYIIKTTSYKKKMFVYINNKYIRSINFNEIIDSIEHEHFHKRLRTLILNKFNIINEDIYNKPYSFDYLIIKPE